MRKAIAVAGLLALAPAAGAQTAGTDASQSGGFGPPTAEEAETVAKDQAAAAEARAAELRGQLQQLQSQLQNLQARNQAQDEQLSQLQQTVEESRQEQRAIEQNRQSRIALAGDTASVLNRVQDTLQTGSYDVGAGLREATAGLSELAANAARYGGEAERDEAQRGLAALGQVQGWLDNGDFQQAKLWTQEALYRSGEARRLAEASPQPMGRD